MFLFFSGHSRKSGGWSLRMFGMVAGPFNVVSLLSQLQKHDIQVLTVFGWCF